MMQQVSSQPIRTFSIGFHDKAYDEASHAKAVATHLGTSHTELYVSPRDAIDVVPRLPQIHDEPFADASQIPTYILSGLTRQHVTVALSGDGGDELLAGYNRYTWGPWFFRQFGTRSSLQKNLLRRAIHTLSPRQWDGLFRGVNPLLPRRVQQKAPGERLYKIARLLDATSLDGVYRNLVSHWDCPNGILLQGRERQTLLDDSLYWTSLNHDVSRFVLMDQVTYLSDGVLAKVDRAAMAHSLETRVPLLDHRLIEFAWRIPLHLKICNGEGKWLLKQLLYRHVPQSLVERPKMGFSVPIASWLRSSLHEWAQDLLSERSLNEHGLFDTAKVRAKLQEHLSGECNAQNELWTVLMFQSWFQEQQRQRV